MSKFLTVFKFEFSEMFKKNSIRITTLILMVVAIIITFVPRFLNLFGDSNPSTPPVVVEPSDSIDFGFVIENDLITITDLKAGFNVKDVNVYSNKDSLIQAINNDEVSKGFIIERDNKYTMIAIDQGLYDSDQYVFEDVYRSIIIYNNYEKLGVDPNKVSEAQNVTLIPSVDLIGKNSSNGFIFAYIMMFIMYALIIFFGQSVATSVAREKDSRTMELLITSTKPKTLILGKVAALGCVGMIQVGMIVAAGVAGFIINKSVYPVELVNLISGSIDLNIIIIYLIFSITGYTLYLFVFAALGSLVSKVEDVSSAITPITFLFVFAFVIASMSLQMPQTTLSVISSFIPFVSLFTMPIRVMLTSVGFHEILISMAIMVVTTYFISWLSIYIYRYGSLNYGNKIKFGRIVSSFKKKD